MRLNLFGWTIDIWVESFCESFHLDLDWHAFMHNEQEADYYGWERGGWIGWLFICFAWSAARNEWIARRQAARAAYEAD